MAATKLQALWNHPAGPKTIHFWAPTFKWGISIANIADFAKPPEKISYPQQVEKLEPFQCERCNGRHRSISAFTENKVYPEAKPTNVMLSLICRVRISHGLFVDLICRQDYLSGEKDVAPQLEA